MSITPSTVSQVEVQLQANHVKKQLRGLFKKVDQDREQVIPADIFYQLIELHQVNLSSEAKAALKRAVKASDKIDYRAAIAQLTIDLQAAGNNDL